MRDHQPGSRRALQATPGRIPSTSPCCWRSNSSDRHVLATIAATVTPTPADSSSPSSATRRCSFPSWGSRTACTRDPSRASILRHHLSERAIGGPLPHLPGNATVRYLLDVASPAGRSGDEVQRRHRPGCHETSQSPALRWEEFRPSTSSASSCATAASAPARCDPRCGAASSSRPPDPQRVTGATRRPSPISARVANRLHSPDIVKPARHAAWSCGLRIQPGHSPATVSRPPPRRAKYQPAGSKLGATRPSPPGLRSPRTAARSFWIPTPLAGLLARARHPPPAAPPPDGSRRCAGGYRSWCPLRWGKLRTSSRTPPTSVHNDRDHRPLRLRRAGAEVNAVAVALNCCVAMEL